MADSEPRKSIGTALAVGIAALVGGLWLLLNAQGVGVPQFKDLWPVLLILAGIASLVDFFAFSKAPRAMGWAVAWTGFGVLAFALTLDYTNWKKILDWLPSFPTIVGLSLIAAWLAGRRQTANLVLAGSVLLGLGVMGFAARFEVLKRILPSVQVFWAILLVVGGLFLVWRTLRRARR